MVHHVNDAAPRRNTVSRADSTGLNVPSIASEPVVDFAAQLSVGGRLVHRRTRRCAAFCNTVASLAGIGLQQEAC
jgi:hypothetical protein